LEWPPFSKEEFRNAINKCNNSFTPRLDHISWKHLKIIVKDDRCLLNFVYITNICIDLSYWPSYFKTSLLIIISKPNKLLYNSPKMFCSIILLNTLRKLIKKIIGERLQSNSITSNFVHLNQLGRLKQ